MTTRHASKITTQALIATLIATTSVCSGQDSKQSQFTPRSVAGILCMHYAPHEYLEIINNVSADYGLPLNVRGEEIVRSIKQRFGNRVHLPFPKGAVLVSTPVGVDYWYCEEALDNTGAKDLIESFAAQWKTPEPRERPIYQVNVDEIAPNQWRLQIFNVMWTPKIVTNSDEVFAKTGQRFRTEWISNESHSRSVWFRLEGKWLWSSYSESLLQADSLALLPDAATSEPRESGSKRFAFAWVRPNNMSKPMRAQSGLAMQAMLNAQMQLQNNEQSTDAIPRRLRVAVHSAMATSLINDVTAINVTVNKSDAQIDCTTSITVDPESQTAEFFHELQPHRPMKVPSLDGESDLVAASSFTLPEGLKNVLTDVGITVTSSESSQFTLTGIGHYPSPAEAWFYGTIKCSSPETIETLYSTLNKWMNHEDSTGTDSPQSSMIANLLFQHESDSIVITCRAHGANMPSPQAQNNNPQSPEDVVRNAGLRLRISRRACQQLLQVPKVKATDQKTADKDHLASIDARVAKNRLTINLSVPVSLARDILAATLLRQATPEAATSKQ